MKILAWLVALMFGALTTRLWFLQVLAAPSFSKLANENQLRLVPIEPLRGEILDRNGVVLAGNRSTVAVVVDRQELGDQEEQVLFRLSNLLHVPVADLARRLSSVRYLPYQPVPVAEDVPDRAVFYIREHPDLFPGVNYQLVPVRSYPDGTLGAHMLGYLYEISDTQLKQPQFAGYRPGEIIGQAGLERTYEQYLHGVPGTRAIQVDAKGKVLDPSFRVRRAVPGDNVVTSIDSNVQRLAEQSLSLGIRAARQSVDSTTGQRFKAPGGAVVVMDPKTGQVLALASYPTYDPSIYVGGISQKNLDFLKNPSNDLPGFDRALDGQYPPGSTFKPFVAAASLKEGFATENGSYPCPASYTVPGDTSGTVFHNWNPVDSGYMSLSRALVESCDTVFYRFGYDFWVRYYDHSKRDNEAMQRDLSAMGFGRPTGIDVPPEAGGIMPTEPYKRQVYLQQRKLYGAKAVGTYYGWLPGDNVNMAIGQGFVQVTPMQLAVAYSAIANGGKLMVPHVGWQVRTPDGKVVKTVQPAVDGRLPISHQQVLFLRNALTGVPARGTASLAFAGFPLNQIPVAGKTGTADIQGKQPTSWFAAMAPANNPKYVVVAMVEQAGHGSTTAAPIVRRILEGLFGLGTSKKIVEGNIVD